jgi:hypothetical protein
MGKTIPIHNLQFTIHNYRYQASFILPHCLWLSLLPTTPNKRFVAQKRSIKRTWYELLGLGASAQVIKKSHNGPASDPRPKSPAAALLCIKLEVFGQMRYTLTGQRAVIGPDRRKEPRLEV